MTVHHDQSGDDFPVVTGLADFDPKSGSLLERALFNHRLWVILFCALITLVLGASVPKLRLNASFERMIPTNHEFVKNYFENRDALAGVGNILRVTVSNSEGSVY